MYEPSRIVRSLSRAAIRDHRGNVWQYHPRSDLHSRIACWGMLFDLLRECPTLTHQIARGAVGFAVNHEMRNLRTGRKKNLDIVVCTPNSNVLVSRPAFAALVDTYGIALTGPEKAELRQLPELRQVPVGSVHLALEAKACMTAHIKALPRLYDELNSSHAAIHGSADHAIAAGFAMVNLADTFVSPGKNTTKSERGRRDVSVHAQPRDTERTIEKIREVPRRTQTNTEGFDALGIVVVRLANDGSPVELVTAPPAPKPSEPWHYDQMIRRMASLYASKFANV